MARTSSVVWRGVWLARITSWTRATAAGSARTPVSTRWLATMLSISPGELHLRRREDDEVIAHPLEVGDDVRREDDRHARLGDGLHHRLHELAAGERIERRDRLVEHEQIRSLGERERERDLRLLAARELAGLLVEGQPERSHALERERVVPASD